MAEDNKGWTERQLSDKRIKMILDQHSIAWYMYSGRIETIPLYSRDGVLMEGEPITVSGWTMRQLLIWLGY